MRSFFPPSRTCIVWGPLAGWWPHRAFQGLSQCLGHAASRPELGQVSVLPAGRCLACPCIFDLTFALLRDPMHQHPPTSLKLYIFTVYLSMFPGVTPEIQGPRPPFLPLTPLHQHSVSIHCSVVACFTQPSPCVALEDLGGERQWCEAHMHARALCSRPLQSSIVAIPTRHPPSPTTRSALSYLDAYLFI